MAHCTFIPPFLLERVAAATTDSNEHVARCCQISLHVDETLRARRQAQSKSGRDRRAGGGRANWEVHTAANGSTLPGELVRRSGQPDAGDAAVDEAAAGTQATLDFYSAVLTRASYDGQGSPVVVTVHYETDYDNAFWDGQQLVFGDGNKTVFERFTKPVDVLAHEFSHGVTQFTAGLTYQGQSGALNESISDVFGSCVRQRLLGHNAAEADWLIGAGIFAPSVQGRALRSMKEPGTAYDDDVLGKDPQVGSMDDYVDTTDDNGGVHINSGIANRAFYLVATALGGKAWDEAAPIWYAALTGGDVDATTDFAGFAAATVSAASAQHGAGSAPVAAVRQAWSEVGVATSASSSPPSGGGPPADVSPVIEVRRSGGFAGRSSTGRVAADDPRMAELRTLLAGVDFATVGSSQPQPDRFVYAFVVDGQEVSVQEQDLTENLRRLAAVVLDDDR